MVSLSLKMFCLNQQLMQLCLYLNKFERKISEQGAVRAGKAFTLFVSNEDMDDIIKIVDSLEKSILLIDGATETVKKEASKQEGRYIAAIVPLMNAALVQLLISSVVKGITGKGTNRAGNRQEGGFLELSDLIVKAIAGERFARARKRQGNKILLPLAFSLMLRAMPRKEVTSVGKGYNDINHLDQNF